MWQMLGNRWCTTCSHCSKPYFTDLALLQALRSQFSAEDSHIRQIDEGQQVAALHVQATGMVMADLPNLLKGQTW